MSQPLRLASGGRIDRGQPLRFSFDGRDYGGYAGDTLASALLANGVRIAGRSFKYHRPRGLLAAGAEEPSVLVQLERGARTQPNLKATQVELYDGLSARAVNCWPGAAFDVGGFSQLLSPLMPAGFYYKTFKAPHWHWYEWAIRRMAGLGHSPREPDPDVYDKQHAHCQVLVIGAGPAGLKAALAEAQGGAEVLLLEAQAEAGGCLLADRDEAALRALLATIASQSRLRLQARTTAFGYYDHNHVLALEQGARPRLWKIRAERIVLATGAHERPLLFAHNDLPGVMLAGAGREYLNRYGVSPGRRVLLATNNDSAYATAFDLHAAGIELAGIVDLRAQPPANLLAEAQERRLDVICGHAPVRALGWRRLRGVELRPVDAEARVQAGAARRIDADALLVSGGWSPAVHLFSQSGGGLGYDGGLRSFVPQRSVQTERSVGAAAGVFDQGLPVQAGTPAYIDARGLGHGERKVWVDLASDVTVADLRLAAQENFRSVEHLKRYTTTGMMADQGKTSNVNAIAVLAGIEQRAPGEIGTTKFRPPYSPVSFGAIAGRHLGNHYRPVRRLAAHAAHVERGAVLEDFGGWLRPVCYPRAGQGEHSAVQEEARAVRKAVGLFDASPLGKILVRGRDAAEFLNRIYANHMRTLKSGQCRYGLMLGEDGVVKDDGICTRLAEDLFLVGTTSGAAERIADWLEEWLQCEWLDLDVVIEPVTTAWATYTVAGPRARAVLQNLGSDIDVSAAAFPHMSVREGRLGGMPLRIMRVSYCGELSYELSVPWSAGLALWNALLKAGENEGIRPYGLEAVLLLRLEKGYVHLGADSDGSTLPQDLGFAELVGRKQGDFVGRRSLLRPDALRSGRRQLVGLMPSGGRSLLPVGAHLVVRDAEAPPLRSLGWVTSSGWSPTLERPVALALIENGHRRLGEELQLADGERRIVVRIVPPCAYDVNGERLRD